MLCSDDDKPHLHQFIFLERGHLGPKHLSLKLEQIRQVLLA